MYPRPIRSILVPPLTKEKMIAARDRISGAVFAVGVEREHGSGLGLYRCGRCGGELQFILPAFERIVFFEARFAIFASAT